MDVGQFIVRVLRPFGEDGALREYDMLSLVSCAVPAERNPVLSNLEETPWQEFLIRLMVLSSCVL